MKTTILKKLLILLILTYSCSKSDDSKPSNGGIVEELEGITKNDLSEFKGEIGIQVSTRNIAKKGYLPAKAIIDIVSNTDDYNQTLIIDEFTNIAQLSLEIELLTAESRKELEDGVPVNIQILDKDDALIKSQSFSVISFKSNPDIKEIDASDLNYQFPDVSFREAIPHFMQLVDEDGNFNDLAAFVSDDDYTIPVEIAPTDFSQNYSKSIFYFFKIPNSPDEYAIVTGVELEGEAYFYAKMNGNDFYQDEYIHFYFNELQDLETLDDDYKFKIKREENGYFTITGTNHDRPLSVVPENGNPTYKPLQVDDTNTYPIAYFRIFTMNIDWEIEPLESTFMNPILPPVETGFGFNSVLRNCGLGELEQQVGIERTIETSTTVGWEESISLSSSETFGGSVTVGVKTEASFFGNGVEVSAEATASYEYSSEATSTNSQFEENTQLETQTYFSNRTITVPSGKASLVYDAYQLYANVKIPFVKRFRVKGKYQDNNEPLNGGEIITQFFSNSFNGVITKIESDYIEVTVRGITTLNNYVETESNVKDVASNCN